MKRFRTRAGTSLAMLAALTLASPAGAATSSFKDAHGDMQGHGADLFAVRVINEADVRVLLRHDDLVASAKGGSSFVVYLDVKPKASGPEYAFVGGSFEGADYQLVRTDGWTIPRSARTLRCDYRLRLNFDTDVAKIVIGRGCLGDPANVRVAVKTGGFLSAGDAVRDWLVERRHLTDWVAKG